MESSKYEEEIQAEPKEIDRNDILEKEEQIVETEIDVNRKWKKKETATRIPDTENTIIALPQMCA